MQPFGSIPVLIDEDKTRIFESRAIARYLVANCEKGSTHVPSPADHKTYGLFEQAASIEHVSLDPAAGSAHLENLHPWCSVEDITYQLNVSIEGREPDTALVEKNHQTLLANLEAYERIISKQKYLGGDGGIFTLADLFHISYDPYASGIFGSQPKVKRWWANITACESWKAVADLQ